MSDQDDVRGAWKSFLLPMMLAALAGILFIYAVIGLNIPDGQLENIPTMESVASVASEPIGPASFATADEEARAIAPEASETDVTDADMPPPGAGSGHRELAEIGGFMAYRGHAAFAFTTSIAVTLAAVVAIWLFVVGTRNRLIVLSTLAAQIGFAGYMTLVQGTRMGAAAKRITCLDGETQAFWDFCGFDRVIATSGLHYGFHSWINLACTVATVSIVFAIFVVARSRSANTLPLVGTPEKCATFLLITASTLLVAVLLLDKSFLHWAFAGELANETPNQAITAYINGTSTFNAALETCLLAATWFVALLLLSYEGKHREQVQKGGEGTASLSVYNISAIFAPVASAIISNMLGG